jgi:hypothetical protein
MISTRSRVVIIICGTVFVIGFWIFRFFGFVCV